MKIPAYLLSFCLMIMLNRLDAQFVSHSYNKDLFREFMATKKTYVLKTGDKEVDRLMEESVKRFWTIKPYEFISKEEMFTKLYDPSFSFLLPVSFTIVVQWTSGNSRYGTGGPTTDFASRNIGKKATDARHLSDPKYRNAFHKLQGGYDGFLAVVVGGPHKYNMGDMVAFQPFKVEQASPDWLLDGNTNWAERSLYSGLHNERYRIRDMVAGIHHSLELVRDNKYDYLPNHCIDYFFDKIYNKNSAAIKDKTLYVLPFQFGDNSTEELQKLYPYKFKEVDFDELEAAILEEKEGIVYFHLNTSTPGIISIVDPHDHRTLAGMRISWFDQNRKTLDAGDLKKVVALTQ